jgi:hypothetical protein
MPGGGGTQGAGCFLVIPCQAVGREEEPDLRGT